MTFFLYDGGTPVCEKTWKGSAAAFANLNGWNADGSRYAVEESPAVACQCVYDVQGTLVERQTANTCNSCAACDQAVYEGYRALRSDALLSNSVSGGTATGPYEWRGSGASRSTLWTGARGRGQ